MDTVADLARALLAVVFTVAAVAKLTDLPASTRTMVGFGVPPQFSRIAGTGLPFAELATAVALVIEPAARWGGVAAAVLLLVFIAGIANSLSKGRTPDCNCFGQIASEPIGWQTLVRNVVLAAVAVLVAANGAGAGLLAWTSEQTAQTTAVLVALAVIGSAVVAQSLQRRIKLLETGVDQLRRRVGTVPRDLPVGTPAPSFELPDVEGNPVTLEALCARGRPVVLLFVGPNCGPCTRLFPELARWNAALADQVTFAVISNGGMPREQVAEHLSPVGDVTALVQKGQEIADTYRVLATPTALVVSPSGMIASASAGGPDEIEALVRVVLTSPEPGAPRGDLVGQAA